MKTVTLSPAYGRDYTSVKALLDDFAAGKDFIIESVNSRWCGSYANKEILKEDVNVENFTHIEFRYGKRQKVTFRSFPDLQKLVRKLEK